MNHLHSLPAELLCYTYSFLDSEDLGRAMAVSKTDRHWIADTFRQRFIELFKFWVKHYANGPENALGQLILRKWEQIYQTCEMNGYNYRTIRSTYLYERMVWSVITAMHPKILNTNIEHPSGEPWPHFIREMSTLEDFPTTEEVNHFVLEELEKLGLAFRKEVDCAQFLTLHHFNPVVMTLSTRPDEISFVYLDKQNKCRKQAERMINGRFSYHTLVQKCFWGHLPHAKEIEREPLPDVEMKEKKRVAEEEELVELSIAAHFLKKMRQDNRRP